MTCPADGLDPDLLRLVRALWTAYDTPCEFPVECAWDDLPDPQRSNWLALARASHDLGVRISGPQVPAAPNPDPVEVGRVGEAPAPGRTSTALPLRPAPGPATSTPPPSRPPR